MTRRNIWFLFAITTKLTQSPVTNNSAICTGWRRETGKFKVDYEISPHGQVPSAHAIRTWVRNFEETGSALKKKPSGVYCLYVSQKTLMLCKLQW
jgi:hypothetical protein